MAKKNIVLMNHTDMQGHHFGCAKVMSAIKFHLHRRDVQIVGNIDGKLDWREDGRSLAIIAKADAIIINGEGSMHNGKKKAGWLMDVATHPATRNKETALINTLYSNNPPEWFTRLAAFDHIYARDSLSATTMSNGIGREVPYLGDLSMYAGLQPSPYKRDQLILGDSVLKSVTFELAKLSNSISSRQSVRLIPVTISMREINPYRPKLAQMLRKTTVGLRQMRLAKKYPKLEYLPSSDAYIDAIQRAFLSVTGRFHATTLAIATLTPFVTIGSNTVKTRTLLEDIGLGHQRLVDINEITPEFLLDRDWSFKADEITIIETYFKRYLREVDDMFDTLTG